MWNYKNKHSAGGKNTQRKAAITHISCRWRHQHVHMQVLSMTPRFTLWQTAKLAIATTSLVNYGMHMHISATDVLGYEQTVSPKWSVVFNRIKEVG